MTIASAISNAQAKVADAYTAVSGMGGTLPTTQNLSNLPTAINSIPAGSAVEAKNFYNLGGVTITSNVATGFGPSKGILIPNTLDGLYSTMEIGFGFLSTSIGTTQMLLGEGENSSSSDNYSISIYVDQSKLLMFLGTGSSWNIASTYGTTTLQSDTRYYVKLTFDGTTYTLKSSTDNTNWTTEATISSSSKVGSAIHPHLAFGFGPSVFSRPGGGQVYDSFDYFKLYGNIYLENCYIKTDGADLWTPFQTPVDYDIKRVMYSTLSARRYDVPQTTENTFQFPYYFKAIGSHAFAYAYNTNVITSFKKVDLSAIQNISDNGMLHAFDCCYSLETLDLSRLTAGRVNTTNACASMCYGCVYLTSVDLSNFSFYSSSYKGNYYFQSAFAGCTRLQTVSLPKITSVYGDYALQSMFSSCTGLTSVTLKIINIASTGCCQQMFQNCTALPSIDMSTLTTISGQYGAYSMFSNCTSLASVNISSLTTINAASGAQQMFSGCSSLTSITFTALTTLKVSSALMSAFQNCTSLTTVNFPALTTSSFDSYVNQFNTMLTGCSGVTVHFPAAIQSTIGSWSSVTSGFGGTNTTVLFDL